MRLLRYLPHTFDPIRVIEWVVAVCTLISPVYVFSPWYASNSITSPPGVIASITSAKMVYVYAILLLIGAVMLIIGLVKHNLKLRSMGLFTIFTLRFFQTISAVLLVGLFPLSSWIFTFTLVLILVVLWINVRLGMMVNGRA